MSSSRVLHLNAFLHDIGHHEAAWRLPESNPFDKRVVYSDDPSNASGNSAVTAGFGLTALVVGVAVVAALMIVDTLPRLEAGAGTTTALSVACAASLTLTSCGLLHATPVNAKPIANMAAPNALIATQRVFSEPFIT